jgi:ParB-like chromosome segregation protein Spo0J
VDLDAIDVTDRIRQDVGDITTLAESIAAVGLLNPLVVTPDMRLVAGERRLAALRHLGRKRANVTVLDFDSVAKLAIAERDENTERLPFTREEQIRAAMRIEEALKPAARERQLAGAKRGPKVRDGLEDTSLSSAEPKDVGQTRDVAAAAVGMSPASYQRGREVLRLLDDAPDDVKPDLRVVVDEMNATGKITPAHTKARELATAKGMPPPPGTNKKKRTPGSINHRNDWHRFDKAWGSFTHACENAVDMPIPDDATPERMESMLRELEGCITGINQLRKRLKEALAA